jgi:hypothetical protein
MVTPFPAGRTKEMVILDVKKRKIRQQHVSHVKGNSGVSEVDYRRYGTKTTSTMRPNGSTETGICGGDENCYESEAHAKTGIFANAFADQWTSQQNDPGSEDKWVCSEIIQHIILVGFYRLWSRVFSETP